MNLRMDQSMADDLSNRCKQEAEYFEMLSKHYSQLSAHCEQLADSWRHAAPDWRVAQGGNNTPDRHSYSSYSHVLEVLAPNLHQMEADPPR